MGEECPGAAYRSPQGWCRVPCGEGQASTSSCEPLREGREGRGRHCSALDGIGPAGQTGQKRLHVATPQPPTHARSRVPRRTSALRMCPGKDYFSKH